LLLPALDQVDVVIVLQVVLIVLCGSVVKGAIAFGLPLLATPLLAAIIGPKEAVTLMILPILASNVVVLITRQVGPNILRVAAPALVAAVPAAIVGSLALAGVDPRPLAMGVGVLACLFAVLSLTPLKLDVPPRAEVPLGAGIGLAAGLLQGATGISGPFVALYFGALRLEPRSFAYAVTLLFGLNGLVQLISFLGLGVFSPNLLVASLALVPVVLAGQQVGFLVMDRLNPELFKKAVVVVVLFSGVNLLLRGLG
jgi:uncharacterized membrane protein YfcA